MRAPFTHRLQIIDSHTGGEPTRVVVGGAPDLGNGPLSERVKTLRDHHDWIRSSTCREPRGHEAMVGALLCEPHAPDCVAGVIYFNNVDYLNMCIHGTIGLAETLIHMGKIGVGAHRIDTPVGVVTAHVQEDGKITVANVPSYRSQSNVELDVPGYGIVRGDVAWGGNWFFLIDGYGPEVVYANIEELTDFCWAVRAELKKQGITGDKGMEIDHIETFGPTERNDADSRNFVLCPGKAYDRSPCGTGTSAKLACLYASGKLQEGEIWRQGSILDSVFEGCVTLVDGEIIPRVTGTAHVNGEATLLYREQDPFQYGINL